MKDRDIWTFSKVLIKNLSCHILSYSCDNLFHALLQGAEKPEKTDFVNKLGTKIVNIYWELFVYLHFLSVREKHNLFWWVCLISRGKSLDLFSACTSQLAWPRCVCVSFCWAAFPRTRWRGLAWIFLLPWLEYCGAEQVVGSPEMAVGVKHFQVAWCPQLK